MASVSGTKQDKYVKQDKYGINMRTWCREHEEQVQTHLLSFRGAGEVQTALHTSEEQFSASGKQPIASGEQFSASGEQFNASGKQPIASGEQFSAYGKQFSASAEPLLTPEELLRLHRTKIRYLQHERLIHLIVLVMTVFGELFTVALVLALPETFPYSLIAMYGVLILLAFYFRHYFLLENTVQHWYRLDDEILEAARKMQHVAGQKP